ncbi:MAG TPA: ankyrin repeat domain-containing protein, partial [Thermoanaerobaculia bacterium]|nr:ankyrin repeat domain-containing protein [Thermoanaerobaculia bacterium]
MSEFEQAVEAVIAGDEASLRALLASNPDLIRIRSERPHRATLLHYVAANGVEDERQITPPNAVAIARILLDAGAEVDAENDAYGGHCTTMGLLVSSVHPARAGVQVALVDTLVDYGAAVDGVANDGSPLTTALAFHYIDAAEALVRRGARVDTLSTAAAMGREDLVREYLARGT